MKRSVLLFAVLSMVLLVSHVNAAIVVHTTDVIPDSTRTHFNGFDAIPNDGIFYANNGSVPYTEDSIQVQQVNGDPDLDIWLTYFHPQGFYGWYPDGGDNGYTRITLADGSDFDNVGFLRASGFGDQALTLAYALLENGVPVLAGTVPNGGNNGVGFYLGFSGGGFNEILVRDALNALGTGSLTVWDGTTNALAIDAIETGPISAIPEPSTYALLATGLMSLLALRWRRRQYKDGGLGFLASRPA